MNIHSWIPGYKWICHSCSAANPAGISKCSGCGFSATVSALEVESARRSKGQEILSVDFNFLMIRRFISWLLRAWPIWAILFLGIAHFFAWSHFPNQNVLVNKITATVAQIVGGLIVLSSVDSNLGLFRKQSIAKSILTWLREFPLVTRSVFLSANCVSSSSATCSASAYSLRATTTLEERVAEVERHIGELRSELAEQGRAFSTRIESVKVEFSNAISLNQAALNNLSQQVERATVGGFKQQAFGVLLVIYGAIISVFT